MTGRLIKYEIRSSIKLMACLWAALIAASLLFSLSENFLDGAIRGGSEGSYSVFPIVEMATGLMYFAVLMALIVATVVIVILRFYKGLLGDEGYLMHTLPVKPWQLITSKGIVAAGVVLVSLIVGIISIGIVAGISGLDVVSGIFESFAAAFDKDPKYILVAVELLIVLVLSLLKSIYQIYASLSIGQLVGKYRILLSLGAYIGLNIIITVLMMIIITVCGHFGLDTWLFNTVDGLENEPFKIIQLTILGIFLGTALQLVGFHIISERILSLKLNLQ